MKVEIIKPKRWWQRTYYRLLEPTKVGNVTIPKDFVTDGASVPRLLWWLLPPTGVYFDEAVLHDYLVRYEVVGTRYAADDYFYREVEQKHGKVFAVVLFTGARFGTIVKDKLGVELVK